MKILFMTNVPSPYRVDFFNELGKKCELTVTFEKKSSDERDSSWKKYKFEHFKGVFLKGKSLNTDTAFCPEITRIIRKGKFDHIICADFTSPTGMIAIQYMRFHKIKYWLESDGGFAKDGAGFKEKVKKHFISGANGYFSTSDEHDKYYLQYGAKRDRLYRYPFTSIKKEDILEKPLTREEKTAFKKKCGVVEDKMIIAVGQFIPRKGFDILIKTMKDLDKNIGVYIVGGQPTDEYIKLKKMLKLDNLHFCGFKIKSELKEYYMAADLFVHPTREDIWGLVVNEAMSCGLPVITTDRCIAGLEMLKKHNNICIVNTDDSTAIKNALLSTLSNEQLLACLANESLSTIFNYTIEDMVHRHICILKG